LKLLSYIALATFALALSACSKSGGGDSIELSDKSAINNVQECPKLDGKYIKVLERNSDGSVARSKSVEFNLTEGPDGQLILNGDHNIKNVAVDGKIHQAQTTSGEIPYRIQAYCTAGKLTLTVHAGSYGAATEVVSLNGDSVTVETHGVGRASKISGTETYSK